MGIPAYIRQGNCSYRVLRGAATEAEPAVNPRFEQQLSRVVK
jgi:hypothetical protein